MARKRGVKPPRFFVHEFDIFYMNLIFISYCSVYDGDNKVGVNSNRTEGRGGMVWKMLNF